jgi:hypothetical protein
MDSVPEMFPIVDAFLRMYSIASFIASFEYVSRILGSAPWWFLSNNGRMNLLSNLLNLKILNYPTEISSSCTRHPGTTGIGKDLQLECVTHVDPPPTGCGCIIDGKLH